MMKLDELVGLTINGSYYYIKIKDGAGIYTARQRGLKNAFSVINRLDHSKAIDVIKNHKKLPWKVLYTDDVVNRLLNYC